MVRVVTVVFLAILAILVGFAAAAPLPAESGVAAPLQEAVQQPMPESFMTAPYVRTADEQVPAEMAAGTKSVAALPMSSSGVFNVKPGLPNPSLTPMDGDNAKKLISLLQTTLTNAGVAPNVFSLPSSSPSQNPSSPTLMTFMQPPRPSPSSSSSVTSNLGGSPSVQQQAIQMLPSLATFTLPPAAMDVLAGKPVSSSNASYSSMPSSNVPKVQKPPAPATSADVAAADFNSVMAMSKPQLNHLLATADKITTTTTTAAAPSLASLLTMLESQARPSTPPSLQTVLSSMMSPVSSSSSDLLNSLSSGATDALGVAASGTNDLLNSVLPSMAGALTGTGSGALSGLIPGLGGALSGMGSLNPLGASGSVLGDALGLNGGLSGSAGLPVGLPQLLSSVLTTG